MLNYTNTSTELANSTIDTVVIPIGATEQFGPHLPIHLDTLVAQRYGNEYGKVLICKQLVWMNGTRFTGA
jgi:creatinine amidohydrolase